MLSQYLQENKEDRERLENIIKRHAGRKVFKEIDSCLNDDLDKLNLKIEKIEIAIKIAES
ncbi:hypothetical protein D3C85_1603130 [compost metagenome]